MLLIPLTICPSLRSQKQKNADNKSAGHVDGLSLRFCQTFIFLSASIDHVMWLERSALIGCVGTIKLRDSKQWCKADKGKLKVCTGFNPLTFMLRFYTNKTVLFWLWVCEIFSGLLSGDNIHWKHAQSVQANWWTLTCYSEYKWFEPRKPEKQWKKDVNNLLVGFHLSLVSYLQLSFTCYSDMAKMTVMNAIKEI